jgi:hypothetical protein
MGLAQVPTSAPSLCQHGRVNPLLIIPGALFVTRLVSSHAADSEAAVEVSDRSADSVAYRPIAGDETVAGCYVPRRRAGRDVLSPARPRPSAEGGREWTIQRHCARRCGRRWGSQ